MKKHIGQKDHSMGEFAIVDQCSLRGHLKYVYTTGKEVYRDGRKTIHWWRMPYRKCMYQKIG
ncbi:hypothetical protein [uncultured Aquimarina sp.]|uniref:hypothetical protein n=1 Tax=uncultured Aquimarina sp. TaxID=575652 RepID=UPI00262B58D9|nr:hypothetical protein [uncultured Aquimarina sp.]